MSTWNTKRKGATSTLGTVSYQWYSNTSASTTGGTAISSATSAYTNSSTGTTTNNSTSSNLATVTTPAPAVISIAALGIVAPANGGTPVASIDTAQYTGTVTWTEDGAALSGTTFATGHVYVATVTLVAKTGFTLTGVVANFFTSASAAEVNTANSGSVTLSYAKI
jgi:hypothetical protein